MFYKYDIGTYIDVNNQSLSFKSCQEIPPLILINVNNSHNVHISDQLFSYRMIFNEIESFQGNIWPHKHSEGEIIEAIHSKLIFKCLYVSDK